jgi:predicted anti-sigma-YlaC factor YlaD
MMSVRCDPTRNLISLGLDRDLSELERALVSSHLKRCAQCRAFETDVHAFTRMLRETPPETLYPPVEFSLPYRLRARGMARQALQAASAAAALAAVLIGAVVLPQGAAQAPPAELALVGAPLAAPVSTMNELVVEFRRNALKKDGKKRAEPRRGRSGPEKPLLPVVPS